MDRRRLLIRSSENLSQIIQLALLHEENINNEYNQREVVSRVRNTPRVRSRPTTNTPQQNVEVFEFDVTDFIDRFMDPSYSFHRRTFDISSIDHLLTYTTYNTINNPINTACPILHEDFIDTDEVILINSCRHIFKKASLLNWLNRQQTCPCCRVNLL